MCYLDLLIGLINLAALRLNLRLKPLSLYYRGGCKGVFAGQQGRHIAGAAAKERSRHQWKGTKL